MPPEEKAKWDQNYQNYLKNPCVAYRIGVQEGCHVKTKEEFLKGWPDGVTGWQSYSPNTGLFSEYPFADKIAVHDGEDLMEYDYDNFNYVDVFRCLIMWLSLTMIWGVSAISG